MGDSSGMKKRADFSFSALALAGVIGAVLVLGAAIWQAQRGYVLLVRDARGRTVYSVPLPQGTEFGIRYIHSVALSPVEEWFSATNDGRLSLDHVIYQDFGAGLPHAPEPGQRMIFRNGHMEIFGHALRLPALEVRVGRVAGHELLPPKQERDKEKTPGLPLKAWAPPGATLTFSLEKPPLWAWAAKGNQL